MRLSPDKMWKAMTPRLHISEAGSATAPATVPASPAMICIAHMNVVHSIRLNMCAFDHESKACPMLYPARI